MKRICTFLLAFLVCVSLAACTSPQEPVTAETMSPASAINTRTGTVVTLGMPREEVEALLGKGTELDYDAYFQDALRNGEAWEKEGNSETEPRTDIAYGGGKDLIVAYYEEGLVKALYNNLVWSGQESGPTNWSILHGITYGSSLEEVLEKYGTTGYVVDWGSDPPAEGEWTMLTYQFDASGRRVSEWDQTASTIEIGVHGKIVEGWAIGAV